MSEIASSAAGTPRAPAVETADHDRSPRDLLVSTYTPVLGSGRAMRTYGLARALATHRGLDLLYVPFGAPVPDSAVTTIPGIELHAVRASRGARRLGAYLRARASGVPHGIARAVSPELISAAARLADSPGRGRVIADGPTAAAALLGLASRRPVVYSAHNLESAFRHELRDTGRGERRLLEAFETRLLERCEESWMVSDADINGAKRLCPGAKLRYAPNVVDVTAIRPVEPARDVQKAIFVASFAYEPNRVALRFLLDEVMPRVWAVLPDATLAIAGGGLRTAPSSDPRVRALGFVEDLRSAYANAACAVVPLLQGGGSPLKLIEALAYELPVIATSRAAGGLELHSGVNCVIADGADRFAASIVEILRHDSLDIGREGRRLAERRYSIEALSRLIAPTPA